MAVILLSSIPVFLVEPFGQRLSYHLFADQRAYLNIPNFMDVVSNISFLIFGGIGLVHCFINDEKWSWKIFFTGIALVSFGSAYYHFAPTNSTLFWDRLPMTIAFMAMFTAMIGEYINSQLEKPFLIIFLIVGVFSVIYWALYDDLRFYYWVQLAPMVTLLILLTFFKSHYTHTYFLVFSFICYLLAKVVESNDRLFFDLTGNMISGHSLKHLLAALVPLWVLMMLKKRSTRFLNSGAKLFNDCNIR